MLRNYLKIALRNILRHKAYSFLNIGGLAIGMACSIFILLWVGNELSYDRFNKNGEQLYRLTGSAGDFKAAVSPAGMAQGLQAAMPEIESVVRLTKPTINVFEVGTKKLEEKHGFYADSNFLQVFSYRLLKGNPATALQRPDGLLITEAMAIRYFGTGDALGKTMKRDNSTNCVVTGILSEIPSNSHLQFDFILPMSSIELMWDELREKTWGAFNFYSYIQFHKNISPQAVQTLLPRVQEIFKQHNPDLKIDFHLEPVTAIHLHAGLQIDLPGHGNMQYVNIFFVVAIFIIVLACINFMNLATARSARRAKEVGLRKVAGAARSELILQFMGESLVISFLSLFIAIGLVYLLLPAFNSLAEKKLVIDPSNTKLWISMLGIALLTGIISGSYPALFLSGFQPVKVLKGQLRIAGGNLLFRNSLVVTQFVVAIVLLTGTAVVYKQLHFIKNKNLGFEKSNLVYLPMNGELWNKQTVLKAALKQNPITAEYSVISDLPTTLVTGTVDVTWEGKDPKSQIVIPSIDVDENFITVFKMKMLAGRSFSVDFKGDSSNYIVNETAMKLMGWKINTAVGKNLKFGDTRGNIIGVVKDFNYKSLQYVIEPLVLRLNKYGGLVMVRTPAGKTEATINALEKINKQLNPQYPFTYSFLDKDLDNLYQGEQQMGRIFNLFAVLAIFISCLGLYGLSAFMAEQRTKEIGVRKVLGASLFNIVYLLSGNFTKLIIIAMLIAIPLGWYAMNSWLNGFAYRIELSWIIFFLASAASLLIAWVTVSYESLKAAIANPVKSLRTE